MIHRLSQIIIQINTNNRFPMLVQYLFNWWLERLFSLNTNIPSLVNLVDNQGRSFDIPIRLRIVYFLCFFNCLNYTIGSNAFYKFSVYLFFFVLIIDLWLNCDGLSLFLFTDNYAILFWFVFIGLKKYGLIEINAFFLENNIFVCWYQLVICRICIDK